MPSIILRSLVVTIAIVISGTPIFAATTNTPQKTLLKYDAKTRKYCLTQGAITGSHIERTTCQTPASWSAQGLNMPKAIVLAVR